MTIIEYEPALDTVNDLIFALYTKNYVLKSIPIFQNYIRNSNPDQLVYYKIAKFINNTNKFQVLSSQSESIKFMANFTHNTIFVTAQMNFKMLETQVGLKNKLHMSKDSISQYSMGMALPKRSALLEPFNLM